MNFVAYDLCMHVLLSSAVLYVFCRFCFFLNDASCVVLVCIIVAASGVLICIAFPCCVYHFV